MTICKSRCYTLIAVLLGLVVAAASSRAAELVVIEQSDCPYCRKFEREIAQAYPNTAEGKQAPLRRLNLHGEWPKDIAHIKIERFTPTFILLDDCKQEVDRLIGYPGDEYFWFLLAEMLEKMPTESAVKEGESAIAKAEPTNPKTKCS